MNIATVFKQSTTTSAARMSTSRIHHRTELSTLSSIDNLKRKKISGQLPQHQQQQSVCRTQTKSSVLMESNSVLNVVQELGNDHRHRHQHRRNSLSLTDERLLKILSAPPDEPLYINNKATLNGNDISSSNSPGDNLLIQYEAATTTSSIVAVDDYENLPPADKCAVATTNIEDGNMETMTSTPQRRFGTAAWNKLQLDLNSPSASCRVRAIRAMNPANDNFYSHFDVTNDASIAEIERSIEMPRTIEEVMKDVIVYVEVRSGTENRTSGIKSAIANLGAKVNDRLLRNTTHVVFKDGLQSTYNKAKSWNIPIVSILWIEACKKHLILMSPKDYPISNVEKFENPDLYEKTKRQKCIQPDTLMKNLHRPIPKSKILEGLKKSCATLSSSNATIDKTMKASPARKTTSSCLTTTKSTTTAIQARKSIGRKLAVDEKPKNTIRSMFKKQLEKSQTLENSQLNGDALTLDDVVVTTQKPVGQMAKAEPEEKGEQIVDNVTNGTCLVSGSLHKRLTRRNSMSLQTPTKTPLKSNANAEISSVLSSVKKQRRCTMFTPSKFSIDEDDEADGNGRDGNQTVNKTVEMEICNGVANKCNSKVRQILNTELVQKTPVVGKKPNGIANMFAQPNSSLRRRTTYTPQVMDETKVQTTTTSSTPISSSSITQRRKTMNVNAMASTPRSTSTIPDALIETKSCDAVLTPTNKQITELGTAFSTTPLIRSLSKTHIDHIRSSTSKTLLDEYNDTFSSKKTPLTDKRRTIANITMDIIKQRIENINRNASFNRSTTDFQDDSFHSSSDVKATPTQVENTEKLTTTTTTTTTTTPANGTNGQLKPLKRKLFTQPSILPPNSPLPPIATPKTDKKTAAATQKRKRTDLVAAASEGKVVPTEKPHHSHKKSNARRSTMFFEEAPIRKIKCDASVSTSSAISSTSTLTASSVVQKNNPSLVFTSFQSSQIDMISEAVKKLGKFKLEKKVTINTTHLVSLDTRRTVNMLRGIIRGVWILTYDWILESVDANKWLPESDYELRTFSKVVEINRIERQAFGRKYRMDLFRNMDSFYLAPNCACKNLKELVALCYGKIVENESKARYFITEHFQPNIDSKNLVQLHPNFILDSISAGNVQKLKTYVLTLQ
ncbi:microcephalin isoform X2 [Sitodiplosis mosellana]|uniref:microcephalin isoform X2 n=1 Tax=Sitodiplosis mosellana TaxID=263140 RepID=UPI002444D8B1|nr:microcephalin isoform X2 [Sitodiplosis mosellana]